MRGRRVGARKRKPVVRASVLAVKRKRRKAIAKTLAALFTVAGLLLGGWYLLFSSTLFALSEVVVEGPASISAPQAQGLRDRIKDRLGRNWLFAQTAKAWKVVSEDPKVKVVAVERQYPGKIVVKLEDRKPFAVLDLGPLFVVDEEGLIFAYITPAKAESLGLPRILGNAPVVVGEKVQDARLRACLQLLRAARGRGWVIRRLAVRVGQLEACGETPILFSPDDLESQLVELEAARHEVGKTGLVALRYDLRFKDQVVVSVRDTASLRTP